MKKIKGATTINFNLKMECWLARVPYDRDGAHATGTAVRIGGCWWNVYQDNDGLYFYAR